MSFSLIFDRRWTAIFVWPCYQLQMVSNVAQSTQGLRTAIRETKELFYVYLVFEAMEACFAVVLCAFNAHSSKKTVDNQKKNQRQPLNQFRARRTM